MQKHCLHTFISCHKLNTKDTHRLFLRTSSSICMTTDTLEVTILKWMASSDRWEYLYLLTFSSLRRSTVSGSHFSISSRDSVGYHGNRRKWQWRVIARQTDATVCELHTTPLCSTEIPVYSDHMGSNNLVGSMLIGCY